MSTNHYLMHLKIYLVPHPFFIMTNIIIPGFRFIVSMFMFKLFIAKRVVVSEVSEPLSL